LKIGKNKYKEVKKMIKITSLIFILFSSQFSLIFDLKKQTLKEYFYNDKFMLPSIFKQKIKIIKIFNAGVSKEKPILFEVNGRKFVFKFIAESQREADYFININDFMTQNLLPIHKLFLVENFENGTYGVFEYFENFITKPFKSYYKIGKILATLDNIMRQYKYSYLPKYETKIEMFNRCLALQKEDENIKYLKVVVSNLEITQKYFESIHHHFDLNCGNLDERFRIINLDSAHYGWRIDNFLNILFVNGLKSSLKGETALLDAISGYNSIAAKKLNCYEIIGIFDIVIGYSICAEILNKPDNILQTNLSLLNYFKIAI
jgi:hypothetical protein